MDTFVEILISLLPACITGFITFLITKYTFQNNVPLDKLEIAYNRIYYPIYCMLTEERDFFEIIDKTAIYLRKYGKYADRSTIRSFKEIETNSRDFIDKKAYKRFEDNIYSLNISIRKKLGYSEPNIFFMYKYFSKELKRLIRVLIELSIVYVFSIVYIVVTIESIDRVSLLVIVIDIIILMIDIMIYTTKKFVDWLFQ